MRDSTLNRIVIEHTGTQHPLHLFGARERRARTKAAVAVRVVTCCAAILPICYPVVVWGHPGLHHDIERVSKELATHPDKVELLVNRAHYYRLDGNYSSALADLDRARGLAPGHRDVALGRGLTLTDMRQDDAAEESLTEFLESGPGNFLAFAARGDIRQRRDRLEHAVKDYSSALAVKDDVGVYIERAKILERLGRFEEAAAGLRTGMPRCHGAVAIRQPLIELETKLGNYDAAFRLVDDVLASVAVKTDWLLRRADIHAAAGDSKRALEDRRRALQEVDRVLAKRSSGIHLYSRAKVHLAMGDVASAKRDLEETLKISPRFSKASELLKRLGERDDQ